MQKKNKKSPAEELIDNVLEDLKKSTEEPSISFVTGSQKQDKKAIDASVFGQSVMSSYNEKSGLTGPPEGLDVSSDNDKTEVQQPNIVAAPAPVAEESSAANDKTEVVSAPPMKPVVASSSQVSEPAAPSVQVSYGAVKQNVRSTPYDQQFTQAENLKLAQARITELEKIYEQLRQETDSLSSAQEIAQSKIEDYAKQIHALEKAKSTLVEQHQNEIQIYKQGLEIKDAETRKLKIKNEELESRLAQDLRKVRVRERELENRLELAKLEKNALVRSKDETILELKRKIEHLTAELDNYKNKVLELNAKIESNQDQFGRTVRALRLALTNLEVNENTSSITIAPVKKAE